MNTTGLPEIWHILLAILSRQTPFMQILLVTLAVLFVVMALEGFRSSLRAIWHAHRTPRPQPSFETSRPLAAPTAFAPRPHAFVAMRPRPKASDQPPRQFRSPRPTIRRQTAYVATTTPAGNVP